MVASELSCALVNIAVPVSAVAVDAVRFVYAGIASSIVVGWVRYVRVGAGAGGKGTTRVWAEIVLC